MFDKSILLTFCKTFWYVPADVLQRSVETMLWKQVKFNHPVLDIGCGNGEIDKFLFFSNKKIDVGLDSNEQEIRRAGKSGVYSKVVFADACSLPFGKGEFATVIANSTLEHIEDDEKALTEVNRVLARNGHFYFTVPSDKLPVALKNAVSESGVAKLNSRLAHFHYRSLEDWKKLLHKSGFKISKTQNYIAPNLAVIWYKLLKVAIFKPYHRELWSYLSDTRFSKYVPKNILSYLLFLYLRKHREQFISEDGVFLFLDAMKIK